MVAKAKRVEALIFDFDGVIVDTESAAFNAWEEIYSAYDARLELSRWVVGGLLNGPGAQLLPA